MGLASWFPRFPDQSGAATEGRPYRGASTGPPVQGRLYRAARTGAATEGRPYRGASTGPPVQLLLSCLDRLVHLRQFDQEALQLRVVFFLLHLRFAALQLLN